MMAQGGYYNICIIIVTSHIEKQWLHNNKGKTWRRIRCASMTTSVSNESDLRLLRTVRNQDTVPVTPPDLAMVTLQPYVTDARSGSAITSVLRRVWRERPEDTWHEEKPVLVRHSLFQGLTKARMVLLLSRNNDIVIRSTSGSSTSPEHCTSCIVSVSRKFVTDIPRSKKKEEKQITDFNLYIFTTCGEIIQPA